MTETDRPQIIMVTGQAGAGHSTALKILEDEGYSTVDNLPLALVDQLVSIEVETNDKYLAFCLDARTSGFSAQSVAGLIENLRSKFDDRVKVIHLSATRAELMRRFQSTRRHHPLAKDNIIEEAIVIDEDRMAAIYPLADISIDSTKTSPTVLRQQLLNGLNIAEKQSMSVSVMSFAYKNGLPANADYVFDMRFLRNPHWDPELRELTGEAKAVSSYVQADQGFDDFFHHLVSMSGLFLNRARKDGRAHLHFAFGCTGGKHRSVTTAHAFATWLAQEGHKVVLSHRELLEN